MSYKPVITEDPRLQNHRLETTLNNITPGVYLFDGERRLVLANGSYADGLALEFVRPGARRRRSPRTGAVGRASPST
ncbi:MAG: hypothetical protein ABSE20_26490 [Acetobacteraceae bacterium]|jgi:PAS domain-containing protein